MKYLQTLGLLLLVFTACKTPKYANLETGVYADVQTTKGDILLKLYAEDTPLTVANFVALAEGTHPQMTDSLKGTNFYDGLKFHRVLDNFMIQGGDPLGTGSGNAGYRFADEFPKNNEGDLLYRHDKKGVLSMANSGANTNSSQFFITHKDTPWLDGIHTVFGHVEKGQTVVDTIVQNDLIEHVAIIRVGKLAKKFDAAAVFTQELAHMAAKAKEAAEKEVALRKAFLDSMGIGKAIETSSGLKILRLKKGTGKKVHGALNTKVHYTLYTDTGKKIDSSVDKARPFECIIDKTGLVAGWKEGVLTMREGEITRLFVPYYLGWGERGSGPIPAKTNVVFEIEVLKVGK